MATPITKKAFPKFNENTTRDELLDALVKYGTTELGLSEERARDAALKNPDVRGAPERDIVGEERKKQRERDSKRRGRRALLLTSGLGLTGSPLTRRSRLLGG